jgi:hypothetical protein
MAAIEESRQRAELMLMKIETLMHVHFQSLSEAGASLAAARNDLEIELMKLASERAVIEAYRNGKVTELFIQFRARCLVSLGEIAIVLRTI